MYIHIDIDGESTCAEGTCRRNVLCLPKRRDLFRDVNVTASCVCACLRTLFSARQGDDDSKHRSGPTLRQWHARALAALASQRNAEQRQGTARLLPSAFGTLLQRKCHVQEGINARWLFLSFCLLT